MDIERLKDLFMDLWHQNVDGINGVCLFDSGKPGPTVGITVMTHGNEPAGLFVYEYLRDFFAQGGQIIKGKIYCVLNNYKAGLAYLAARHANDDEGKAKARRTDLDMNRLPDDVITDLSNTAYEAQRVRELWPIWSQFEFGLDIHSVSQPLAEEMIMLLNRSDLDLIKQLPFRYIISNIEAVMTGKSASHFYGHEKSSVYGLEAGNHEEVETIDRAVNSAKIFLQLLEVMEKHAVIKTVPKEEYRVFEAVWFPNESYELIKTFKTFEFVKEGTVLATGDGEDIMASKDCYVIFSPKSKRPSNYNEEVLFLTERSEL